MYVILKNNEQILMESSKQKVNVTVDYDGNIYLLDPVSKDIKTVNNALLDEQIKEIIDKAIEHGWEENRFDEMKSFLKELIPKASAALKVDPNKLFGLMRSECDYSAINYFQQSNFHNFKESEDYTKKISELNKFIYDLKNKHNKELVKIQKELTAAKNIKVDKCEVKAHVEYDFDCNVNCPHCDSYEEIDLTDYDHDGDTETINECDKCGKYFNVIITR